MSEPIRIRVEVYLPYRGERRWKGEVTVPPMLTVDQLPQWLGLTEPELAVLVNGRNAPRHTQLRWDDDVAILRQAEGGA